MPRLSVIIPAYNAYDTIARIFPMFPLTVEGLEDGMKKLLSR